MKMINEAREELESTLRHNDEIREEEGVRMAQTIFFLNTRPYMTRWKHCLVNHMVQEEGEYQPNQ